MLDAPLLPQPNLPNYGEPVAIKDQTAEQKKSTGGELLEKTVDKVRRVTIRGQIDGG